MTKHEWANYKRIFIKDLKFQTQCMVNYMSSLYGSQVDRKLIELIQDEMTSAAYHVERLLYAMPEYKEPDC